MPEKDSIDSPQGLQRGGEEGIHNTNKMDLTVSGTFFIIVHLVCKNNQAMCVPPVNS